MVKRVLRFKGSNFINLCFCLPNDY